MQDMTWQDRGACLGSDPDLWFPGDGESSEPAKRICNTECPVRDECLDHAFAIRERYGVWGGTSETDRRRIRRQALAARRAGKLEAAS